MTAKPLFAHEIEAVKQHLYAQFKGFVDVVVDRVFTAPMRPDEVEREDDRQRAYFGQHNRAMLLDVAEREVALGERVVVSNAQWVAVVPFWASWPFETLLLPRFPVAQMPDLTATERDAPALVSDRCSGVFLTKPAPGS